MKLGIALGTALVAGLSSSAHAQISVPAQTESATTSGLATPIRSGDRTYQAYYAASNFTTSVTAPTQLTGMRLRLAIDNNWRGPASGQSWPSRELTLGTYEIVLAKPSSTLVTQGKYPSLASTFSSFTDSPVVVRSGTLTIPVGAFQANASGVQPWGPLFNFTTPYLINPGEGMVLQLRLTSFIPADEPQPFFASGTFVEGQADAVSDLSSATAANPTGFTAPLFVNFVPTPGAAALFAMAGLVAVRRRR
ncbi:MAG: hypothetical protein IBJ11_10870 [Phycisphaerales bacterium]|nr:hypothetical protein [Phycisphaerales bacterium]